MTTVRTKCYPTVWYFSIAVVKYPSQRNSREKVYFCSQFEVLVHPGRETIETRWWSNWSHCIHSQTHLTYIVSRASAHPSLSSLSTLFSPGILLPRRVPSTVTVGPLLGRVMHTSGGKGSRSLWVLGQPMQQSDFQFSKNLKCQNKPNKRSETLKKMGLPTSFNLTIMISYIILNFIKLTVEMNHHKDLKPQMTMFWSGWSWVVYMKS